MEISLLELVLMHKLSRKCSFPCAKVLGTCTLLLSSIWGFWKVVSQQTCTSAMVFEIFHLLFWFAFIWQISLEKKNLAHCLLKTKWLMKKLKFFELLKMQIFVSHFVFRQKSFLSKETTYVPVTKGTLWSDKVWYYWHFWVNLLMIIEKITLLYFRRIQVCF